MHNNERISVNHDCNGEEGMKYFALYMPATASCIAAGLIGFNGYDGWGWCLFVALLLSPSFSDIKEIK